MIWILLALAHAGGVLQGQVELAGKRTGPVVVYVDGDGPAIPDMDSARVVQQGKEFHPQAVVVRQGATVDFANEDKVFHHVFSRSTDREFEIEEYGRGEHRMVRFDLPGVVEVQCNKHSWMRTQILVLPNAWYAQVDEDGAFEISGVEPGARRLVLWAAGHVATTVDLTVVDGENPAVKVRLKREPKGLQQVGADGIPVEVYPPR